MSYSRGARGEILLPDLRFGQQKKASGWYASPNIPFPGTSNRPSQVCVFAHAFSECLESDPLQVQLWCQPEKKYIFGKKVKKTIEI